MTQRPEALNSNDGPNELAKEWLAIANDEAEIAEEQKGVESAGEHLEIETSTESIEEELEKTALQLGVSSKILEIPRYRELILRQILTMKRQYSDPEEPRELAEIMDENKSMTAAQVDLYEERYSGTGIKRQEQGFSVLPNGSVIMSDFDINTDDDNHENDFGKVDYFVPMANGTVVRYSARYAKRNGRRRPQSYEMEIKNSDDETIEDLKETPDTVKELQRAGMNIIEGEEALAVIHRTGELIGVYEKIQL